jgi:hypothetical protein
LDEEGAIMHAEESKMSNTYEHVRNFLAGIVPGPRGNHLSDILAFSDDQLESRHDFIQWCFPLSEPSAAVPNSPVLTIEELRQLGAHSQTAHGTEAIFTRMLAFYGLMIVEGVSRTVAPAANFAERADNWLPYITHNDRRISRILRSLTLQGHTEYAQMFYDCLLKLINEAPPHRKQVLQYWENARVLGPPNIAK